MNKTDVIVKLFESESFQLTLDKVATIHKNYLEDFKQDLFIILMSKPDELIIDLHQENKLLFYTIRIMLNQLNSNTSPYYKTYRKHQETFESIDPVNKRTEYILERYTTELEDLPDSFDILKYCNEHTVLTWYELQIFSKYYKLGDHKHSNEKSTFRGIEEEYGIDHVSVHNTVKDCLRKLKEHFERD